MIPGTPKNDHLNLFPSLACFFRPPSGTHPPSQEEQTEDAKLEKSYQAKHHEFYGTKTRTCLLVCIGSTPRAPGCNRHTRFRLGFPTKNVIYTILVVTIASWGPGVFRSKLCNCSYLHLDRHSIYYHQTWFIISQSKLKTMKLGSGDRHLLLTLVDTSENPVTTDTLVVDTLQFPQNQRLMISW